MADSWYHAGGELTLFCLVSDRQQISINRLTHLISCFKTHGLRLGHRVTLQNTNMKHEAVIGVWWNAYML